MTPYKSHLLAFFFYHCLLSSTYVPIACSQMSDSESGMCPAKRVAIVADRPIFGTHALPLEKMTSFWRAKNKTKSPSPAMLQENSSLLFDDMPIQRANTRITNGKPTLRPVAFKQAATL